MVDSIRQMARENLSWGAEEQLHQSPYHLQRTFKEVVGVSPQQYAEACRMGRVRATLRRGDGIAEAVYGFGFGSVSRMYDKAGAQLGMTPGVYQQAGAGAQSAYTLEPCPLGWLLMATALGWPPGAWSTIWA